MTPLRKTLRMSLALVFFSLSFVSTIARADLFYSSEPSVRDFLLEIENRLPPKMKAAFHNPILVRFEDYPESRNPDRKILGEVRRAAEISANKILLDQILLGPEKSATYPGAHGNYYRLAQATVAHEFAHLYDNLSRVEPEAAKSVEDCASILNDPDEEDENSSDLRRCQTLLREHSKTISSHSDFQSLMGFSSGVFTGAKELNRFNGRSPDPYEFTNPAESFAVNFEFFILDPQYRCRRPSEYDYLSHKLDYVPFPDYKCEIETQIPLFSHQLTEATELPTQLDPSRIYQVHYLLAQGGSDFSSRWGHAMFRIVLCAPERKSVGPECLKDIAHHVVLSYRANISDLTISNWDGLTGKYPSQLFLLSFPDVLEEYNEGELRDMVSVPLALSRDQIREFIQMTLEEFWGYRGKYYFLTNNCATESARLLQIVDSNATNLINGMVVTPTGLYETLEKEGLINPSSPDTQSFVSKKALYARIYHEIQSAIPEFQKMSLDDFLSQSTVESRANAFDEALSHGSAQVPIPRLAAVFLVFEIHFKAKLNKDFENQVVRWISENAEKGQAASLEAGLRKYLETLTTEESARTVSGYGIPMREDFASGQSSPVQAPVDKSLSNQLKALFPDALRELNANEAAIGRYRSAVMHNGVTTIKNNKNKLL